MPRPVLRANDGRVLVVSARVKLTNLKITGGDVSYSGGGIRNTGTLTLKSTEVIGNSAAAGGGGIYNRKGTVNLRDAVVLGNTATYGGGIYSHAGTLTLRGTSSVMGNTADSDDDGSETGGGIFVGCAGTLTGAVDGVNVNDNYLGTASPVEDNIFYQTPC